MTRDNAKQTGLQEEIGRLHYSLICLHHQSQGGDDDDDVNDDDMTPGWSHHDRLLHDTYLYMKTSAG